MGLAALEEEPVNKPLRFLIPTVFALAIPVAASAQRTIVTTFNYAANYVVVIRTTTDVQTKVDTVVFVYAFAPRVHPFDAPPTATPSVGFSIVVANFANAEIHYLDSGTTSDFELVLSPGLLRATLRATIPTYLGETVSVDLSWDAAGSRERRMLGPYRDKLDGFFYLDRADFVERAALVSGSVSGRAVATTFQRVSYARLGTTHQGSVEFRLP